MSAEEQIRTLSDNNIKLNAKIEELEIKLSSLSDKIDSTKIIVENYTNSSSKTKTQIVKTPEAEKISQHDKDKLNSHNQVSSNDKKDHKSTETTDTHDNTINTNELGEIALFNKGIFNFKKKEYQDAILTLSLIHI